MAETKPKPPPPNLLLLKINLGSESHTFEIVCVKDGEKNTGSVGFKLGLLWGEYDSSKLTWDQRNLASTETDMMKDSAPRISFGTNGVRQRVAMDRVVKIQDLRSRGYLDFTVSGLINLVNWTVHLLSIFSLSFMTLFVASKDRTMKTIRFWSPFLAHVLEPQVNQVPAMTFFAKLERFLEKIMAVKAMCAVLILLAAITVYDYFKKPKHDSDLRKYMIWTNRTLIAIALVLPYYYGELESSFPIYCFGNNVQMTSIEPYRLLTANFIHSTPLHIILNTVALLSWTTTLSEIGYGWSNFLVLYIGGGIFSMLGVYLCEYISSVPGSLQVTVGASGAIYGVLVFGKLYLGRLLGAKEGAVCTALAMFLILLEAALAMLNPSEDSCLLFGIYTIALVGLLGDRKMSFFDRIQLHKESVINTIYFLYMMQGKGAISHTGHAFGGLAGLIFFHLLVPLMPGPFITSSDVASALSGDVMPQSRQSAAVTVEAVSPRVQARASSVKKMLRLPSVMAQSIQSDAAKEVSPRAKARAGSVKKLLQQNNEDAVTPRQKYLLEGEQEESNGPPLDDDSKYVFYQAIFSFVVLIFVVMVVEWANPKFVAKWIVGMF